MSAATLLQIVLNYKTYTTYKEVAENVGVFHMLSFVYDFVLMNIKFTIMHIQDSPGLAIKRIVKLSFMISPLR